ncbi:serine/threonine-protein kinase [Nocardioides plantarum]|uniref:non-specific serine/threonine protein kinase n=1 Tax=Nocardioides plantarum TaxID=29299 RepID=A0ABV5KIR9_9ACTN|nr:serine/threonine-protein kinase [Nocardioides plantarum]
MGEVFAGRYELLDPVATGGMGTIWRVLDRSDGQLKAAKILRQSDAASLLRFVREQSVRIDHTHVVTPLSWAGVDDRVLFTMPLVHGGSVADLLHEHGALPPRWVAVLTDQLLQALEAVHAAGIVHRDVKPGNLLLEPTGTRTPHLRLTDFGIAVPLDQPRMTHGAQGIGTPGYMPPEQWHGGDPDPRSDLYAVGRVVLEMLLGRRLTDDDQPATVRIGSDPSATATRRLVELVAHATQVDPADRPATATQMRAALADLVALPPPPGEPVVDVPDRFPAATVPDLPPPPPPRHGLAPTAAPTIAFQPGGQTSTATAAVRPSALPGALLLLVGLVGLVLATWLLLG